MVAYKIPELTQGMNIEEFNGLLDHKNPKCSKCNCHCYTLYRGGKKERMGDMFVCKNCNIIYTLPAKKRCEFTEVSEND